MIMCESTGLPKAAGVATTESAREGGGMTATDVKASLRVQKALLPPQKIICKSELDCLLRTL